MDKPILHKLIRYSSSDRNAQNWQWNLHQEKKQAIILWHLIMNVRALSISYPNAFRLSIIKVLNAFFLSEYSMHVFYLLSSNGKLLVTKARLERVWTRLADRLAIVVADTSMITILPEYAGHFCDLYINGKENVKLTGNCMKMFMLTPPFMLRYLIILIQMMYTYPILRPYLSIFYPCPEHIISLVSGHSRLCSHWPGKALLTARLYRLDHVTDPSDDMREVLISSWSCVWSGTCWVVCVASGLRSL